VHRYNPHLQLDNAGPIHRPRSGGGGLAIALASILMCGCSPTSGRANAQERAAPAAKTELSASRPELTFDYATQAQEWELYDAVAFTGSTGVRTTVLFGPDRLEVHQVEKTADCASIVADVWMGGRAPTDDSNLQAFLVCPLSRAPADLGGAKMLTRVQPTDLEFKPNHKPIGMSVELIGKSATATRLAMNVAVMVNADDKPVIRSTYSVWRNLGQHFVLFDLQHPKEGALIGKPLRP
jgi:hypothetical protein